MRVEQRCWTAAGWDVSNPPQLSPDADLILAFDSAAALQDPAGRERLRAECPNALLVGCSTAGEIHGTRVVDNVLAVTAIDFEQTELRIARTELTEGDSFAAGRRLAIALSRPELVHVLVLSDGLRVDGAELTRGLSQSLPAGVSVTGGLAADGDRFNQTYVLLNGFPEQNAVAAIGLYGSHLRVGFGSCGGWEPFGPERIVTRCEKNVLFDLDRHSALGHYEKYLAIMPADCRPVPCSFPSPFAGTTRPAASCAQCSASTASGRP